MTVSAVLVTALLRIKEDDGSETSSPSIKSISFRINAFKEMLKIINGELFLHVFVDESYYEMFKDSINGIPFKGVIQKATLTSLRAYKIVKKRKDSFNLPHGATQHKDTREFLILMNSKTELVKNAILFHNTHSQELSNAFPDEKIETKNIKYGWIDFNIGHIFKTPSETLETLKRKIYAICKDDTLQSPLLYIPGCRTDKLVSFDLHKVNWRFCGGFFFGDVDSILKFDLYYDYIFEMFDVLTWEVNMWNIFEAFGWKPSNWYEADHDDSMITNIPIEEKVYTFLAAPTETTESKTSCHFNKVDVDDVIVSKSTSSLSSSKEIKSTNTNTRSVHLCRIGKKGPIVKFIVDELGESASNLSICFSSHYYFSSSANDNIVTFASSSSSTIPSNKCYLIPFDDETFENGLSSTLEFYGVEKEDKVWENKKNVLFWRGGISSKSKLRNFLVESFSGGSKYDIKFVKDATSSLSDIVPSKLSKRASQKEHLRHKFILSVHHDDFGQVGSNLQWIFGSGSVPIILLNDKVNFWFKKYVKNMENCIIITYTEENIISESEEILNDLKQKIDWLNKNDETARRIASKALELSEKIFSSSFQMNYIRSIVLELL